ncbi:MAG: insulinase family protein [Pseudomonadota bacterium]
MTKLKFIFISLIIVFISSCTTAVKKRSAFDELNFITNQEYKIDKLKYDSLQLESGISLNYLKNNETPIVNILFIISNAGSIFDPKGKKGLSDLTCSVIKEKLDDSLTKNGNFKNGYLLESYTSPFYTIFKASVYSEDVGNYLKYFGRTLKLVSFNQDKINKLSLRIDNSRESFEYYDFVQVLKSRLFAKTNPLGALPFDKTELNFSDLELAGFFKKHYDPSKMALFASGDIASNQFFKYCEDYLDLDLKAVNTQQYNFNEISDSIARLFIYKMNTSMATIVTGNHIKDSSIEDLPYIKLLINMINNRIIAIIRGRENMSYFITSELHNPGFDGTALRPGVFFIIGSTEYSNIPNFIKLIFQELDKIKLEGFSDYEININKNKLINSLYFEDENIVDYMLFDYERKNNGYGSNYLENFIDQLSKLDKSRMFDLYKKYFDSMSFKTVVFGKEMLIKNRLLNENIEIINP